MTLAQILDTILQWTKSPFIPLLAPAFCKNKALISGFIYNYQMIQLPLKKIHVLMLKKFEEASTMNETAKTELCDSHRVGMTYYKSYKKGVNKKMPRNFEFQSFCQVRWTPAFIWVTARVWISMLNPSCVRHKAPDLGSVTLSKGLLLQRQ